MTECEVIQKVTTAALARFNCTRQYHRHNQWFFPLLVLTDGCHFLRERAHCYWLFDAIGSHLFHNEKMEQFRRQWRGLFWELTVKADNAARLTCYWDSDCEVDRQKIGYTDIGKYTDIETVRIWTFPTAAPGGHTLWVCLLPSEY